MRCGECGSIDIARWRSSWIDKLIRTISGRKRFGCRRCGWSALRAWDEAERQDAPTAPELEPLKPMAPLRTIEPPRLPGEFDISRFD